MKLRPLTFFVWRILLETQRRTLVCRCTTAVLCVKAEMDLVLAGTFGARIVVFDRRAGGQILRTLNVHNKNNIPNFV